MGFIILTGIPGVGKTTVMKKGSKETNINFVTFGEVMLENAKEIGLVKNKDEIRKLTLDQQKDLQLQTVEKIVQMKTSIIDTHITIKTPKGYLPGLPYGIIQKLNSINSIIIIEADPVEIYSRRAKDTTRKRDIESKKQIEEHQQINRVTALTYAVLAKATVKLIHNHDNNIEDAVKQLIQLLK
jgi:adenylate kinase